MNLEKLLAIAYARTYDAIVLGFTPYDALADEIAAFAWKSTPDGKRAPRVLDVSAGTGTLARKLALHGCVVVGCDAVEELVVTARGRSSAAGDASTTFHHVDVVSGCIPEAGTYDAVVSLHTVYWHPDPHAVLRACRRALRPGGHAIVTIYERPARVWRTFAEVRRTHGMRAAAHALRWLIPTALFETLRSDRPRYWSGRELSEALTHAGFDVLEMRPTFLADLSVLAWARPRSRNDGTDRVASQ